MCVLERGIFTFFIIWCGGELRVPPPTHPTLLLTALAVASPSDRGDRGINRIKLIRVCVMSVNSSLPCSSLGPASCSQSSSDVSTGGVAESGSSSFPLCSPRSSSHDAGDDTVDPGGNIAVSAEGSEGNGEGVDDVSADEFRGQELRSKNEKTGGNKQERQTCNHKQAQGGDDHADDTPDWTPQASVTCEFCYYFLTTRATTRKRDEKRSFLLFISTMRGQAKKKSKNNNVKEGDSSGGPQISKCVSLRVCGYIFLTGGV